MSAVMGLKEYARKRHFDKTPEPGPIDSGREARSHGGFFCVQRHDATRLHYDFRLEVGGVLVSWAVPKGPSLDPARKALAMKVEDHPFDYGTFEGKIPEGNYGAGSVMLWDTGTYDVLGDLPAEKQLERGDFKFELHGQKLNGSFAIVHMKHAGKGNEWLLIKKKDEYAVQNYDINQFSYSVKSKRTQDEIAEDKKGATWLNYSEIPGARKAAMPASLDPMLATAATKPPGGNQWLYEIKWDGVRALCRIRDGEFAMFSRRGNRCEKQYPELRDLPKQVGMEEVWLDGEICVLNDEGRSSFGLIQHRINANPSAIPRLTETHPAVLFLFDVLYAGGYDFRACSLQDRRKVLESLVQPAGNIRISDTYDTDGEQMFEAARNMGLEGVLAKDRRSKYESGRSSKWQKLKVLNEQEFVIAGFTKGERDYFGSLVLGVYEDAKLRHTGQVGTGFDTKKMREIHDRLQPLITKTSPFPAKPRIKDVTWVKPETVCEVRFLEWTADGVLRAPVFVGLRNDKEPSEVVREVAPDEPDIAESDGAEGPVEAAAPEPATDEPAGTPLDLSKREAVVDIDGHTLKFSNLEKVFYPKEGWKKRDLLDFYHRVSTWLLPHLKDRPLSLKRYPNGIHDEFFFQKNASSHFPDWMHCEPIQEGHPVKTNHYPVAQDRASLLYLVNLGCIDHNPWMSRIGSLDNPDWMLLDLDPVDTSFDRIIEATLLVKELLAGLGLRGYPKTTGGDGMHVYVPLEPIYSYEQVRSFAELITHLAVGREPDLFTTPRSVEKRKKDRVYFDYLQIGSRKTIAAPYVLRAYDGAPVATPLDWAEVKPGIKPSDFRIDNAIARFEKVGDLFAPVLEGGQRIEHALGRLQGMDSDTSSEPKAPAKRSRKPASKKGNNVLDESATSDGHQGHGEKKRARVKKEQKETE
ncbi:MAG: DNA ligase D [Bryobacteraceae bacterium]